MLCRQLGGSAVTTQVAGPGGALVLWLQHPPCPPEPGTGSRVYDPSFFVLLASLAPSPRCILCISAFKGIYNLKSPTISHSLSLYCPFPFSEEITQPEGRAGTEGYYKQSNVVFFTVILYPWFSTFSPCFPMQQHLFPKCRSPHPPLSLFAFS